MTTATDAIAPLLDEYRRALDYTDALWRDLGVVGNTLNDSAPLAAVRRTILS